MSYAQLELAVIQWSSARKIIPNSTPLAQWKKAAEELDELKAALVKDDLKEIMDGVGDTVVCLINICALLDINLTDCLELAYEEIKDRSGTMGSDGIFYKDK
jgi:NTP pyrophosphatase (non-canonical NTP hydrolase)